MTRIAEMLPTPRIVEVDHVDVAVGPADAYRCVRHLDAARSPIVRALFALRIVPDRIAGRATERLELGLDAITSHSHGFRLLADEPGESFTVGAIGHFWKTRIEYADVAPERYAAFDAPGWGKVAWEVRCEPRGEGASRITVELRVGATDDGAWAKLRAYYRVIGPFSHFIRRHVLALAARELGTPDGVENERPLPGDELVPDARAQVTHFVDLPATPERVWPWLVQMGCRRAGWYSWDALDNGGAKSASEIHPEWQSVAVGDVLPATPTSTDGFRVLRVDPDRVLVLGGVVDLDRGETLPIGAPRPDRFWQTSWAFVLEPLDATTTRLHVRARVAFAPRSIAVRALVARPIHHFMESAQLRHLRDRIAAAERERSGA